MLVGEVLVARRGGDDIDVGGLIEQAAGEVEAGSGIEAVGGA